MKYLIVSTLLMVSFTVSAQIRDTVTIVDGDSVHSRLEFPPQFPDGEQGLFKYLTSIKYPERAREKDIEGLVIAKLIVDKAGKVKNPEIIKSSGSEILDKAVIVHVNNMPDWTPGLLDNKPVSVFIKVPVKFTLW